MPYDKAKYEKTIIAKYGSMEAYRKAQAERGSIGGKKSKRSLSTEEAREIGRKGAEKRWGKNGSSK